MDEITVTKGHMDALKALAEVNLKVSEARNHLTKLQEEETEYLVSREKKAVERIQNVLILSHSLVEETNKNYEIIEQFGKDVGEGADLLSKAVDAFQSLTESKDEHYKLWEKDIKGQEDTIVALRNGLKVDLSTIESARKQVEGAKVKLAQDRKTLDDDRAEVNRAIKRLKENRI